VFNNIGCLNVLLNKANADTHSNYCQLVFEATAQLA
jgi:hypothetical protein